MSRIRIEWVPINKWRLGVFGFDHLQLVFQRCGQRSDCCQSDWWVLEGTRDSYQNNPIAFLGINGFDGRTSLAESNPVSSTRGTQLPTDPQLQAKIGTPTQRGSHVLPVADPEKAWNMMCSYAYQFDSQRLPYICAGFSPTGPPTITSASVVASLLYYGGIELRNNLPTGMRHSPGTKTLIGLPGRNEYKIPKGFNAVVTRKNANTIHATRMRTLPSKTSYAPPFSSLTWRIDINNARLSKTTTPSQNARYEMRFEYQLPALSLARTTRTPRDLSQTFKYSSSLPAASKK